MPVTRCGASPAPVTSVADSPSVSTTHEGRDPSTATYSVRRELTSHVEDEVGELVSTPAEPLSGRSPQSSPHSPVREIWAPARL